MPLKVKLDKVPSMLCSKHLTSKNQLEKKKHFMYKLFIWRKKKYDCISTGFVALFVAITIVRQWIENCIRSYGIPKKESGINNGFEVSSKTSFIKSVSVHNIYSWGYFFWGFQQDWLKNRSFMHLSYWYVGIFIYTLNKIGIKIFSAWRKIYRHLLIFTPNCKPS